MKTEDRIKLIDQEAIAFSVNLYAKFNFNGTLLIATGTVLYGDEDIDDIEICKEDDRYFLYDEDSKEFIAGENILQQLDIRKNIIL